MKIQQRTLPQAPSRIVDEHGQPRVGTYQGAPDRVDLGGLRGDYQPRCLDRFVRNKEWTYTALAGRSQEGRNVKLIMGITDMHYASNGFVTVFDVDQKKVLAEHQFMAGRSRVTPEPVEGLQASFTGWAHRANLILSHPRGAGQYSQHIDIAARKDQPAVAFDGVFGAGGPPPATVITPKIRDGESRPTAVGMTVKSQALSGAGTLTVGEETFHLSELNGAVDYSSGTMNRHTRWRWGSATGVLEDGRKFGLNLVAGFNDADPRANENLLWVQGADGQSKIVPLPPVNFEFDAQRPMEPWRVTGTGSFEVDLRFQPYGMHSQHTNLGLIASNFDQPSGHWEGSLTDTATGEVYRFRGADGEAENQNLKW
ncbi:hypothetical protein ABS71_10530 [bacterium SCN 62-11]|nr:DUF2804 domain-containing protein [Candidatus Eremiobacteraeota bacterium]ODT67617.1 MAG: hypothetical protein ABS71_10530 [bacterium SCN 62-11]